MDIVMLGPAEPRTFARVFGESATLPEGLGGTPVTELAAALLALGHNIHLITASPHVENTTSYKGSNLSVHIVPYRIRPRDRALDLFAKERGALSTVLADVKADILHVHWTYEFAWAAERSNVPTLVTAHDAPLTVYRTSPDAYRLARTLMAYRVRLAISNLSAVSPYLASRWRREMLYRRDVAIVPNIVPQLAPRDACRSGNVIVDIADSSPRKNVKRLLEAFALVKRARPESELRLIGPGLEPASNMCQWAAERELIEGVAFLGRQTRDQVAEHLAEASVMCHASVEEAQPMCLLEAMAMGVPVIGGQRSGGVPWTLGADAEEGAAGLLVDVTSPVAMSQQMLYLLERDDEQERLRSLGETLVRDRHAPSIIAESFLTHYERIAG